MEGCLNLCRRKVYTAPTTPPPPDMPEHSLNQLIKQRLPQQNWAQVERDCETVLNMFREPGAKSLVRLGDGELRLLQMQPPKWFQPQLAHAIQHADCLGFTIDNRLEQYQDQYDSMHAQTYRSMTINTLRQNYQIEVDQIPQIDSYLFYNAPELIGQLAAGKRVLWVTSQSWVIVNNLKNQAFRDYYGLHGIAANDWINTAMTRLGSLPKYLTPKEAFEDVRNELIRQPRTPDFDLALVGVGAVGKLVCHYIKTELSKSAIDIGALMSAMQGVRNRVSFEKGGNRDALVWDPHPQ